MKLKKLLFGLLVSSLTLTSCGKSGNIENAKYIVLSDDGVPSHSALKGSGSKNYSALLDEKGKTIVEYKEILKEPYISLSINKDYAYTTYGSPIKINLKTGIFEKVTEKIEDYHASNLVFHNDIAYYATNEGVNMEKSENDNDWYNSRIINEEGKEIWVGYSIDNISFNEDKLYISATDRKANYKLFETDRNLEKLVEINDNYTDEFFIGRFSIGKDFFSAVVENEFIKKDLVRIKDNKKFSIKVDGTLQNIFENGKNDVNMLFYSTENKNYIQIQVDDNDESIENLDELLKLRGLYEIKIDENSQTIVAKQIISLENNRLASLVFYNNCVSIDEREGVRLYDLETGKEIFSVQNENAKAIFKIKK